MIYRLLTILLLSSIIYSCKPEIDSTDLSTDIVFNPNTDIENTEGEKLLPEFKFEYKDFDFGVLFQGEQVIHKFKFTNTGGSPLIISDVSATCGCTIPTFSKEPIMPGEEGFIEVKFDSAGRKGVQHKSVTILANTQPNRIELTFIAEIEVTK